MEDELIEILKRRIGLLGKLIPNSTFYGIANEISMIGLPHFKNWTIIPEGCVDGALKAIYKPEIYKELKDKGVERKILIAVIPEIDETKLK